MAALAGAVGEQPETVEGLAGVREIFGCLEAMGLPPQAVAFDPHLARGLDYYTGPIYETVVEDLPHLGSVSGGGRYDRMIGELTGREVPACGTTLGLDRITTALEQLEGQAALPAAAKVLVALFSEELALEALRLAASLRREGGLAVEVYPGAEKLARQFAYADRKGIPLVAVVGPDELAAGRVSLKDLRSGRQEEVRREELAAAIRVRVRD
jgi:histidyl-tRNA synthetase